MSLNLTTIPSWASEFTREQLGKYIPPTTLPSVMPIHMHDKDEYDEVEVHPCIQCEDGNFEQCEPDDPELMMWSCYLHYKRGGLECVADFETEKEADAYANFLKVWLLTAKKESQVVKNQTTADLF